MVIIACREVGDFVLRQTSFLCRAAAVAENGKGVAVTARDVHDYFRVFGGHFGGARSHGSSNIRRRPRA